MRIVRNDFHCQNPKCNNPILKNRGTRKYCSTKCYQTHRDLKRYAEYYGLCLNPDCDQELLNRQEKYCSKKCSLNHQKLLESKVITH